MNNKRKKLFGFGIFIFPFVSTLITVFYSNPQKAIVALSGAMLVLLFFGFVFGLPMLGIKYMTESKPKIKRPDGYIYGYENGELVQRPFNSEPDSTPIPGWVDEP